MIVTPAPRHRLPDIVLTPFGDQMLNALAGAGSVASGTWPAANRAMFYPIYLLEPFVVSKAFWLNGATVGTDSIDLGVYLMTDQATGRMDLICSTGPVLSAGTANVVQEASAWKAARVSLLSGSSSTDATSYAMASATYKAGRLYLLSVQNTHGTSATAISSVTGGGNFVSRASTLYNTNLNRISLWSWVPTADFTGVLTIDFGGVTQTGACWAVTEQSGVDTTTTDGIVQTATGTGSSVTPLATLAAFGNANNATFGCHGHAAATASTPGAGFTELDDVTAATPAQALETEWAVGNDTTVDATITSAAWGAIGAEIKAGASPFVIPPSMPGNPNVWMGLAINGTTATVFRSAPTVNVQGLLQANASFPLPPNLTAIGAVGPRVPIAGVSSRSLIG